MGSSAALPSSFTVDVGRRSCSKYPHQLPPDRAIAGKSWLAGHLPESAPPVPFLSGPQDQGLRLSSLSCAYQSLHVIALISSCTMCAATSVSIPLMAFLELPRWPITTSLINSLQRHIQRRENPCQIVDGAPVEKDLDDDWRKALALDRKRAGSPWAVAGTSLAG